MYKYSTICTGYAEVLRPTDASIQALEDSHAKSALLGNPEAVAAFDKVAFTSGSAVFTLNTATDIFTLHDSTALVAGGGKLTGGGQMWIAPIAEEDPQAIAMQVEGYGIATKEVIKNYLPEVCGSVDFESVQFTAGFSQQFIARKC